MSNDDKLPRFCREARSQLPALVSGELTGWPLHVVRAHLRRCVACSAELERQKQLAGALTALRDTHVEPPIGLLDDLLAQANRRGVRERAAVPARGAISGARPELSVAFLTVGAIASTGIGYGLWRGARALRTKRD
jgi:predicted anti-sigma-YlaC factor YlaD